MSAVLLLIADAVKDALAAAPAETFGLPFTPTRAWLPEYTIEELASLKVTVAPGTVESTPLSRAEDEATYTATVGVQKKVDPARALDMDPLGLLVEQIADYLNRKHLDLGGGLAAKFRSYAIDPAVSPELLVEQRVFTSVITLTYRLAR